MKKIKSYENFSDKNIKECLKRLGFEKVSYGDFEEMIENECDGNQGDGVYEDKFGYLSQDDFCIFDTEEVNLINPCGNNYLFIEYKNKYYMGYWNELEYNIDEVEEGEIVSDLDIWDEFKSEMLKQGVKTFFCDNF